LQVNDTRQLKAWTKFYFSNNFDRYCCFIVNQIIDTNCYDMRRQLLISKLTITQKLTEKVAAVLRTGQHC